MMLILEEHARLSTRLKPLYAGGHAKNRSGESIGCGLQMRATQCSQLSCPLRITISTRRK